MAKMNREDLFREIGEIDEAYVEEAERAGRTRRAYPWVGRMLVAAASLVFCVGVGYMTVLFTQRGEDTGGNAGGSAMNAEQEQYSVVEDTDVCPAGGLSSDGWGEEQAMAETAPEMAPGEAPAVPDTFPEEYGDKQDGFLNAGNSMEQGEESHAKETEEDACIQQVEKVLDVGLSGESEVALNWEAARTDEVYGRYVDVRMPEGYDFAGGIRSTSFLRVTWNRGAEEITVTCRQADEGVSDWLVDVEKPEEYDLGLYTIPWGDSVPQELQTQVFNATFLPEQITPEIAAARTFQVQENGELSENRTQIGILYSDNVLVEITGKGPSAEEIYAMIYLEK